MENLGFTVLRFTEVQVLRDVQSVVRAIYNFVEEYEAGKRVD